MYQLAQSMRALQASSSHTPIAQGVPAPGVGGAAGAGTGGPAGGAAAPRVSEACVAQMQAGDPLLARTVQQLLELLRVFSFGP